MSSSLVLLFLVSLTELLLLVVVLFFFMRLRRSESLLNSLQEKQESLLRNLHFNAELEQELVSTFEKRQTELGRLNSALEERILEVKRLLQQTEQVSRSPHFLREVILSGRRQGKSVPELASSTGLSVDEVELILDQASQ
ncbi:MAG: hypothetical protein KKE73_12555 [Proteobacteria bacterium]|nr:hypothetical protein [Pseudomonadota bacterium]